MKILVLNGPNLNLLGRREPEIYGQETLRDLENYTKTQLGDLPLQLDWKQSNLEGELINYVHQVFEGRYDALIINPGAYSHTSIALYDALKSLSGPIVEVHLSQTYRRESFRHKKVTAKAASIVMEGLGKNAYYLAALALHLRKE